MTESQPTLIMGHESTDVLQSLESKVRKAVELVHHLRTEQAQLKFQLETATGSREEAAQLSRERDQLKVENERLKKTIASLEEERKDVRARVEKIQSQLDLLGQ